MRRDNGRNGAHFCCPPPLQTEIMLRHRTDAAFNKHLGFAGVTWGLVEAGGSVGGCSFITVVTMEEPEPKTATMGEGASLGGVTWMEGEAAEEKEGGSSKLSSGSGRKPGPRGQRKEKVRQYCEHKMYHAPLQQQDRVS